MAKTTLESLPNEVLLKVFRELRSLKPHCLSGEDMMLYPSRESSNRSRAQKVSICGTLHSMCLVSRRLSKPATEVLYENVQISGNYVRNFIRTVSESPHLAKLVRRVHSAPIPAYEPIASYFSPGKEVEREMEKLAQAHGLTDALRRPPGSLRLRANENLERALAIIALEHLTSLTISAGETLVTPATPQMPGHILRALAQDCGLTAPVRTSALTVLHIYCRGHGLIEVVPVLGIPTLQTLSLSNLASGPLTMTEVLQRVGVTSSSVKTLRMPMCGLVAKDLGALAVVLDELLSLIVTIDLPQPNSPSLKLPPLDATTIVACFEPAASSIKSFTVLISEGYYWDAIYDLWQTSSNAVEQRKDTYCRLAKLAKYTSLKSLVLPTTAMGLRGLDSCLQQFLDSKNLPSSIEALEICIPDPSFFPGPSPHQLGLHYCNSTIQAKALIALLGSLCDQLLKAADVFEDLTNVSITIPSEWPYPNAHGLMQLLSLLESRSKPAIQLKGRNWSLTAGDTVRG